MYQITDHIRVISVLLLICALVYGAIQTAAYHKSKKQGSSKQDSSEDKKK